MLELRLAVYDYLKKNNKTHVFNDKPPGEWWVRNFLERNKERLTLRTTQNITKARAEKTIDEFKAYFENLEEALQNLPPANILNYDETNLSDNPGSKKCIFRRGVKYPERIMNHTKGCISLMFAGTAEGKILPPYVVYKSINLWTHWGLDGPDGALYNRTSSGWFDSVTFLDWFTKIIIPWASQLKGPKLVIGDNLSSHLNPDVLDLCEANEIRFVFLPSRSTQIAQPLDVAFFGPLKKSWREILLKYKIENPNQTTLNKSHFPLLLKKLMDAANMNTDNVKSGFKATGIYPFNPYQIYNKLPEFEEEIKYDVDQSVLQYLKETKHPNPIKRGKNSKLNIPPGKSVSITDILKLSKPNISSKNKTNPGQSETQNKRKIKILSNIVIQPGKDVKRNDDVFEKMKVMDRDIPQVQDINEQTVNTQKGKRKHENLNSKRLDEVEKRRINNSKKTKTESQKKKKLSSESSESYCTVQLCDSSDYDPDVNEYDHYVENDSPPFSCSYYEQEDLDDKTKIEDDDKIMNYFEAPNLSHILRNKEQKQYKEKNETEDDNYIRLEKSTFIVKSHIEVKTVGYLSDDNNNENEEKVQNSQIHNKEREKCHQILRDNTNTYQYRNQEQTETKEMTEIMRKEGEKEEKEKDYKTGKEHIRLNIRTTQDKNMILPVKDEQINKQNKTDTVHVNENISQEKDNDTNQLVLGQTVLVRYFIKKKWKYYCGVIEDIEDNVDNCYQISFYKTETKKKNHVEFVKPKREDIDKVPESVIVKPIELLQISENPTKFVLMDDDDSIYF